MAQLPDGTITPSYLDFGDTEPTGFSQSMSDTALRVGRIVAAHEVDSTPSKGKKILEYDVIVRHANGTSGYTDITYSRVKMSNVFGGTTDFFRWTPRIENFDYSSQIGKGSRVLLLCVNGNQRLAYIIGGIPNPEDKTPVLPFSGHHLEFQFNGIYANVDKNGTFTLIHRGATDVDNKVVTNNYAENGSIRFDDVGDITLGYGWSIPEDNTGIKEIEGGETDFPYIKLIKERNGKPSDQNSKAIEFFAPTSITSIVNKKFIIKTKEGVKVNPSGSEQQAWLRGTAFRSSHKSLHDKLMSALGTLSEKISDAGQAITQAASSLQSTIVLPPAGIVTIKAAALTLNQAGSALSSAKSAISDMKEAFSSFEGQDSSYLSNKHQFSEDP